MIRVKYGLLTAPDMLAPVYGREWAPPPNPGHLRRGVLVYYKLCPLSNLQT